MVNFMIDGYRISFNLWEQVLLSACYILNRIFHKGSNLILYEIWEDRKHYLNHLKILRCLAKIKISGNKKRKLDP